MNRAPRIAGAALVALALAPAAAAAKEITAATVCGADGCRAVERARLLPLLAQGGPNTGGPGRRAEHFVVRIRVDGDGEVMRFTNVVVPSAGRIMGDDGSWMELSPPARRAYTALTAGREPFPAAKMPVGNGLGPLEARVDSVWEPPAPAAAPDESGVGAWPWWLGAALVAAALAALLVHRTGAGSVAARRLRMPPGAS